MRKSELLDLINWIKVLGVDRYAGAQKQALKALFEGSATLIDHYEEGGYQGVCAYAWELPNGQVVLLTDYFGSCGGCDGWEGISDEEAKHYIKEIVINSRIFNKRILAKRYCESSEKEKLEFLTSDFAMEACKNLKL